MEESIGRHVTYKVLVDYKDGKLTHKDNSLAFQKARKSEKRAKFNIHFDLL